MYTHLTDEGLAKISEILNNALYLQLQDMKAKQITDQKIIDREQNMRALADEEIECLKSDLVLICKVEHEDILYIKAKKLILLFYIPLLPTMKTMFH